MLQPAVVKHGLPLWPSWPTPGLPSCLSSMKTALRVCCPSLSGWICHCSETGWFPVILRSALEPQNLLLDVTFSSPRLSSLRHFDWPFHSAQLLSPKRSHLTLPIPFYPITREFLNRQPFTYLLFDGVCVYMCLVYVPPTLLFTSNFFFAFKDLIILLTYVFSKEILLLHK